MKPWRNAFDRQEHKSPGGKLKIIRERCKGCGFCIEFCPRAVLRFSDTFNAKGYRHPVLISGKECLHCGLCEALCPEFAIYCLKRDKDTKEKK